MTGFDRLHPALQHHIVNSLGWQTLRPLQESSIEPVLAGSSAGARTVVAPEPHPAGPPGSDTADIEIDFVGSTENAAHVLSRLYRGEKRLVFCDSRSRVEDLAFRLRELGVQTHVSHGSLGVDERRRAEQAFAEARDCVIVATSTLELGIDVGNLDRVIQIEAPSTVSGFLQRLGRTGRRPGSRRNLLFLTTSSEALLRAAAISLLWSEGFVEPVQPPALPFHIYAQQALALVGSEPTRLSPIIWSPGAAASSPATTSA